VTVGLVRRAAPAALAALLAGLASWQPPATLVDLNRDVHDAFARQTTPPSPSSRIAIVALDEASLAAHGQWPWPRDLVARLIDRLAAAGVAVIAVDVLFPEADRLSRPGDAGSGVADTDATLARAMAAVPVVAAVALTFEQATADVTSRCDLRPVEPIVRERAGDIHRGLFAARGAVCSIGVLMDAARASGTINVSPDDDGVLRRIPVVTRVRGRLQTALALAAVAVATSSPIVLDQRDSGSLDLQVGEHRVPLDANGQILLRQRGPGRAYAYHSASDVLSGLVGEAALRGRMVFLGATALGVRDTVATALDPRFPGVEIHATLADTFLGGPSAMRLAEGRLAEILVAMVAAAFSAFALPLLGGVGGLVAVGGAGAAAWYGARSWFAASGSVVSPIAGGLGLLLGVAVSVVRQLATERGRTARERLRREQAQRLIVQTLTTLTETRDVETGRHARRTQELTRLLATTMAARGVAPTVLTPHRIDLMATLAPLHDIGKVGISDAVLHKPGHLTADEYTEMKRHTSLGHDTLEKAEQLAGVHDDEVLALAKDIVFTHHERWDGSGYPRGLKGEAIPLPGRIVAVVDTYDALIAERPYKPARPHRDALAIITDGRGTHFDPAVVDAFLACHAQFEQAAREADPRPAPTPVG
jgi:adenylate cyclase